MTDASSERAPTALVWDPDLAAYDFGRGHPLAPVRVELTVALIRDCGLLDDDHVTEITPSEVSEDELLRVHRPEYVEVVKRAGEDPGGVRDIRHGLGPGDNPTFRDMHAASLAVCGASKAAAEQVWESRALHAFNPAGGLHHAMPDRAAGFCIYNDPAVAIDWLLRNGAERIAYVDVDVHHGDGVEAIFADDPRVLTVSLHESGRFLFPGTGSSEDIGGPDAPGSAANLPLHPGTTGDVWLRVFDEAVAPLLEAFEPEIVVSQLGCDTHATDPLAHLALTVDDDAEIYARLHRLAHELCGGRWVATGGGGYQLVDVVPRAWTLAFAEMTGGKLPVETPMSWRELAGERTGQRPPTSFTDATVQIPDEMRDAAIRAADTAIAALHDRVLPHHS